jgi:hypothetical protein
MNQACIVGSCNTTTKTCPTTSVVCAP